MGHLSSYFMEIARILWTTKDEIGQILILFCPMLTKPTLFSLLSLPQGSYTL